MRDTALDDIVTKLAELRRRGPKIFGTSKHHYRLVPPLPEETVAAFEREHRIILPEDYRRFVTEVGDGLAGPGYGLYPLKETVRVANPVLLSRPFPHHEAWDPIPSPEATGFDTDDYSDEDIQGTLCISDQGCGMGILLVLTGAERGNLWLDDRDSDMGVRPVRHSITDAPRVTFLPWYTAWLDESLALAATALA